MNSSWVCATSWVYRRVDDTYRQVRKQQSDVVLAPPSLPPPRTLPGRHQDAAGSAAGASAVAGGIHASLPGAATGGGGASLDCESLPAKTLARTLPGIN